MGATAFDEVRPEATAKPQVWDLKGLIRFAAIMGPMSSIFDFLTFGALLFVFRVSPAEFRTTWFLKTMITQILVIFIIRTNGRPWRNRPSPALAASSLVALVAAMALPFTPAGAWFGFQAPPPATLAGIGILVVVYHVSAELLKPWAIGGSRETRSVGPEGGSPAAGEAILSHAAGRSGT
jgi:Mg2+-importing ATPase